MKKKHKRVKNSPSPELEKVIRVVNLFPLHFQWSDATDLLEKVFYEETGIKEKADFILRNSGDSVNIHSTPENLPQIDLTNPHLKSMVRTITLLKKQLNRYFLSLKIDSLTNQFALSLIWLGLEINLTMKDDLLSIIKEIRLKKRYRLSEETSTIVLTAKSVICTINKHGQIAFQDNQLIKALNGVDSDRLKICRICGSIFWAHRLDKRCCSTRCGNMLKMRELREREKKKKEKLLNYSESPRYHERFQQN